MFVELVPFAAMGRVCALIVCLLGFAAAPAAAQDAVVQERVAVSDGVELQTTLTGAAPLAARPVLVEFSPYGRGTATFTPSADYNRLLVQIRGTGDSDGQFDALGPRTQQDVADILEWACRQPWSDGRLALRGFSASAITVYNSLHLQLPCVRAALLGSGTFELYRDLLYPGGVSNLIPGVGVLAGIGGPALAQGFERLLRDPLSSLDTTTGIMAAGFAVLQHPTQDQWWRERGFRGDVNHLPILMVNGFFDVESRGAFETFQRLRRDGAHLLVTGAHDGAVGGTDGGGAEQQAWLDRYVRGVRNGVAGHPRVQLWMADGDREELAAGTYVKYDARNWPVPGTRWRTLALGAARSGTAASLNDGVLGRRAATPGEGATPSYPALASLPTATDPPNAGIVGNAGLNALTAGFPPLGDMTAVEGLGLSWTTKPLKRDWLAAGPAMLDLRLASTAPTTAIWVVVSDVSPDGVPHPVAAGRLLTDFQKVVRARSRFRRGKMIQPYGNFAVRTPVAPGVARRYRVELWPIGNRFKAGHRIRLHLIGASAASAPTAPGVNTVTVNGSRLLLPVLPRP
jgi:predicted acyl esterase